MESGEIKSYRRASIRIKHKTKASLRLLDSTLLLFLQQAPKCSQKVGDHRMYTFQSPFLYSEDALRGAILRSAPDPLAFHVGVSLANAVRFLFGGFSSTAGYVPGNEAHLSENM